MSPSSDYRRREPKKPKKGAKKPSLATIIPTPTPEVEVVKRPRKPKETEEEESEA
ncbi:MAG: hypothetical protein HY687_01210 [Chloroflexi bacterium]|nr:hypothetical protein [Chloroflexota bacterium]